MEKQDGRWRPIAESSQVTALGENLKQTGSLAEEAIQRTLKALAEAWRIAREHNADVQAFGTMALRMAENAGEFLQRATCQQTPVSILSGEEEARLGLLSVATDPTFAGEQIACVDVGGHSTEIGVYDRIKREIVWQNSFAIGTLGLKESLGQQQKLDRFSLLRACALVDEALADVPDGIASMRPTVVAVGASATNLISIERQLEQWDPSRIHGETLSYESISPFVGNTWSWTDEERASLAGIEPGRECTIHLGALILERALHALRAEEVRVSVRGWRHAIIEDDTFWIQQKS
jgi:exopolyphosphatase/guanosine-5'-triphosphate,3'-diphosphate pyrophosphatase